MLLRYLAQLCLLFFELLMISPAWADDPFISDNAEVLLPHHNYLVLYAYYNSYNFGKSLQGPALEFDFNVTPNFEVDTFTPIVSVFDSTALPNLARQHHTGQIQHDTKAPNAMGLGDINIELKYRFIQETEYIPQVALGPNFFLPTGDYHRGLGNGRFYYYPAITAQKTIRKWLLYGSTGYVVNGAPNLNNYYFGGVVAQNQLNEKLALGIELFSQGRSGKHIASSTLINLGSQYNITKDCTFFTSLGKSIAGENQWLAYLGIGWEFAR